MEAAMDSVFIQGLVVDTVLGVADWERAVRQRVRIDVTLERDLSAPGRSDDIADAIDYAAVSECARAVAREGSFHLVEALAQAVADAVLARWRVAGVRVTVTKSGVVPGVAGVGASIQRTGSESA